MTSKNKRIPDFQNTMDEKKLYNTYLVPVVCPTTEFQKTSLLVKREKFYVNFARRFEYGGWLPFYQTVMVDCGFCGQSHFEKAIRTRNKSGIYQKNALLSEIPKVKAKVFFSGVVGRSVSMYAIISKNETSKGTIRKNFAKILADNSAF